MAAKSYTRVKDQPDHRDRYYRRHLKMGMEPQLPPSADLRGYCSPVENQLDTSSCTGHACVAAVEVDENFSRLATGKPFVNYSRLFVYYNERAIEGDTSHDGGGQIRDVIKALADYGVCQESLWPFNPHHVLLKPSMEAYADALNHKAVQYERVPQTQDAIMHCLAVTQRPIVFGVYIYDSFEGDAAAASGIIPMPSPGERLLGGHAILAVGYDLLHPQEPMVIFRNSWDTTWGDQGYGYLPLRYVLDPKLSEDFWVVESVANV